ncbi:MAG: N-formylglutamate amidohydrolase [Alphaproteobacteria bacterium]
MTDTSGIANSGLSEVIAAGTQRLPLILASPHSGCRYPPEFLAQSRLDSQALRKSEDCYVDEIFAVAPRLGAPMLRAHFPRIYVDPNREPFELDPHMFAERLPDYVNANSPRVSAGLGTIPRLAAGGEEIYGGKLAFADALRRIESCYQPYHTLLKDLIDATVLRFGFCILLDCHSMPPIGGPTEPDAGRRRVDFVLGDCFGTSCAAALTDCVEARLVAMDYTMRRNAPYSGGFTTRHYGRPPEGVHVLQIEINRALYMDPETLTKRRSFATLTGAMANLVESVARLSPEFLHEP